MIVQHQPKARLQGLPPLRAFWRAADALALVRARRFGFPRFQNPVS
jgi:hypothetical protein